MSTTSRKASKTDATNEHGALLDYLDGILAAMLAAARSDGKSEALVQLDEVDALSDNFVQKSGSGDVADVVRGVLAQLRQKFDRANGDGQRTLREGAVRAATGSLAAAIVTDALHRVDAGTAAASTSTRLALQEAETAYANALAELKRSADAADLEALQSVRPAAEVTLPVAVDEARLANLSALIDLDVDAGTRLGPVAEVAASRLQVASEEVRVAQERLAAAELAQFAAHTMANIVDAAGQRLAGAVKERREERDELATSTEREKKRRFRRFAGLPDDETSAVVSVA